MRACGLKISSENLDISSRSLKIKILMLFRILLMEILEFLIKFTVLVASISSTKHFRIPLNFFSEIQKWIIYLFSSTKSYLKSIWKF